MLVSWRREQGIHICYLKRNFWGLEKIFFLVLFYFRKSAYAMEDLKAFKSLGSRVFWETRMKNFKDEMFASYFWFLLNCFF